MSDERKRKSEPAKIFAKMNATAKAVKLVEAARPQIDAFNKASKVFPQVDAIARTMQQSGIKQTEIAAQLGISQSTVSRILNSRASELQPTTSIEKDGEAVEERMGRARVTVNVSGRMTMIADDLGLDLEELFATIGMDAVRTALKRRLMEQNGEAIEDQNCYFEKHGLPLAKYRTW